MTDSFDEMQQLAGEYVLGTLTSSQRDEVERRLAADPALRTAVHEWEHRLHPLTSLVPPQEPSSRLWPRIVHSLRPAATNAGWRRWWNDVQVWRILTAGSLAVAVTFGVMFNMRASIPHATYMVVLVEPQGKAPGWVVQAGLNRQVTLTPLAAFDVPNHKAMQFWTKADNWNGPVSLGLVQPGKPLTLTLDRLPPLQPNQLFEITLEPETGSPTGKPTGPILYIGRAVKVT